MEVLRLVIIMTKSKYKILSHNYEIKGHNFGTLNDKYEIKAEIMKVKTMR